jgi:hypothetical protein
VSFGLIAYHLWVIEHNKADILSLYALLTMQEIVQVYQSCSDFMEKLNTGSTITHLFNDMAMQREAFEEEKETNV